MVIVQASRGSSFGRKGVRFTAETAVERAENRGELARGVITDHTAIPELSS